MLCRGGFEAFSQILGKFPGNYLEIGVFEGDGIANLAAMYPKKRIFGVDPFIEDGATSWITKVNQWGKIDAIRERAIMNTKFFPNIKLYEMTSKEFADKLSPVDIHFMDVAWVLIDGSHHYEDVKSDYKLAMRLIGDKRGGIVFDDVDISGVKKAYDEFLNEYENIGLPTDLNPVQPGHVIFHGINK